MITKSQLHLDSETWLVSHVNAIDLVRDRYLTCLSKHYRYYKSSPYLKCKNYLRRKFDLENIKVRPIAQGDNPYLAKVIRDTLTEFKANHPGTVYYDSSTDHLYELFQEPASIYYVAEIDGVIAGGVGIYPTAGLPAKTCELVKMYLVPSARGFGLGKTLIEKALSFASNTGFKQVYIETMPELAQAMKVYEKFGFKYLDKQLGSSGHFGCAIWMLKSL